MAAPWMPLYVADYLSDTVHLTAAEHGAYLLLIMRYWQDGKLPDDERLIARYSRLTPEQWAESRDIIAALFDDGWRHARIEEELARADEIISKRRAAATARHSKRSASAVHVQSKCSDAGVPPTPTPIDSEANASGAPAPRTVDPKTILFREALPLLATLTGRKPEVLRPVLGRWMKLTGDDCGSILTLIERCRGSPVADPISWIEASLKPRDPNGKPRRVTTAEQTAAALARVLEAGSGGGGRTPEPAGADRGYQRTDPRDRELSGGLSIADHRRAG